MKMQRYGKLLGLLASILMLSSCALMDQILIQVTEQQHPEWVNTNVVVETPEQPTPPPTTPAVSNEVVVGPTLSGLKAVGGNLHFKFTGYEDWPHNNEGKKLIGKLMVKGVFVDSISLDNAKTGNKTMENAFGVGEHSIDAQHGEIVPVYIISNDKKRKTNVVMWPWAFPST